MLLHAKMYELGDKYDVKGLKELSGEQFARSCRLYWDTEQFPVAARHALGTTPEGDRGLRDTVCWTVAKKINLLNDPEVEKLVVEFGGVGFCVLKMRAKDLGWKRVGM